MQPYSEIGQLPAIDYAARRQQLLASMPMNSCAVIPSAREITRSRDTEFSFRQDSDF
jgi:Xaa-Pro aminopeptidase